MSVLTNDSVKELEVLTRAIIADINSREDDNLIFSSSGVTYLVEVLRRIYSLLKNNFGTENVSSSAGRYEIITSALHPDIAAMCCDELERALQNPHGHRLSHNCISCICETSRLSSPEYLFYSEVFVILLAEIVEMVVFGLANRQSLSLLCNGLHSYYLKFTPSSNIHFRVTIFPWHITEALMDDTAISTLLPPDPQSGQVARSPGRDYRQYCEDILEHLPLESILCKNISALNMFGGASGACSEDLTIEDDRDTVTAWYARIMAAIYNICASASILEKLDVLLVKEICDLQSPTRKTGATNGLQQDGFDVLYCTAGIDDLNELPQVLSLIKASFDNVTVNSATLTREMFGAVWGSDMHKVKLLSSLGVEIADPLTGRQLTYRLPGVSIDYWDMDRMTLMGYAVCREGSTGRSRGSGGDELVRLVKSIGGDVDGQLLHVEGTVFLTYLGYAIMNFRLSIIDALLNCGADVEARSMTFSRTHNIETDIFENDPVLLTPLQLAIEYCNVYAFTALLDEGASVWPHSGQHAPLHTLVHMLHKWHDDATFGGDGRDAICMTSEIGLKLLKQLLNHGAPAGPGLYAALECVERRNALGHAVTPDYLLTDEIVDALRVAAYWEKNKDFCMFLAACGFLESQSESSCHRISSGGIAVSNSCLACPTAAVFSSIAIVRIITSFLPIFIPDNADAHFEEHIDIPCGDAGICEW